MNQAIKFKLFCLLLVLKTLTCLSQNKYPVIDSDSALAKRLPALSNWGRWKENDELGTLNYLTPPIVLKAKAEIRTGISISLARKVSMKTEGMRNPAYEMQKGEMAARDYLGAIWHGFAQTHLDALCHIFADTNHLYNGYNTNHVDSTGCKKLGIDKIASKGITGRGVLIDIANYKGNLLEPGTAITIKDVEQTLLKQGTQVMEGDIIFVRTGAGWKNTRERRAGLHPECLFWVKEKKIALLGGDGDNDVHPLPGFERYASAFHSIAIPWLGLPLIDNADLDKLSEQCIKSRRWSFFVTISPWNIEGATSSPINPIAIF